MMDTSIMIGVEPRTSCSLPSVTDEA